MKPTGNDRLDRVRPLLLCSLGTSAYREQHLDGALAAASGVDPDWLRDLSDRLHITGPLAELLDGAEAGAPLASALDPLVDYQRFFNRVLGEQLRQVAELVAELGIDATVLKGPSMWGRLYDDPATRRIHDLDLMVQDPDDMRAFAEGLQRLGFAPAGSVEEALANDEDYELPPFVKRVSEPVSPERMRRLRQAATQTASPFLIDLSRDDRCEVTVIVEPHKSLFSFVGGGFPEIPPEFLRPTPGFEPFTAFRDPVLAAYLAPKFVMDAQFALEAMDGRAKCAKLVLDVVRALEACEPADIELMVRAATNFGATHQLVLLLQLVRPLVPDLELANLPETEDPTEALDALLIAVVAVMDAEAAGAS